MHNQVPALILAGHSMTPGTEPGQNIWYVIDAKSAAGLLED